MNIIDAIKSGKPFKRTNIIMDWLKANRYDEILGLSVFDIIADDWEIQEKQITISESQLEDVIKQSLIKLGSSSSNFIEHIKKELGFKNEN